ncbi:MAG: hypothetical protein QHJ73_04145, partial [Armatimonadota bacterium]|nr:hypothetical protein [Armatimonadota bacterium]
GMFAQGCCGNINSDRVGADFEVTRRLGVRLGAAAAVASDDAAPLEGESLRAASRTLLLPFLPPPPLSEAEAERDAARAQLEQLKAAGADEVRIRVQQGLLEWAEDQVRAARHPEEFPGQPFEIQVLAVGELAWVALPGEVFIELAQQIQRRSPFAKTVVLGYSNGCIGYVPTASAYPDGGYEVNRACRFYGTLMIAPESERLIVDAAVEALQQVAR